MAKAGTFWNWAAISSGCSSWAGLLDIHFSAAQNSENTPKYFDWLVLLKFCTAFEPYTKQYTASIRPQKIAEFLLFDSEFPHSICFSVDRMTEALARVAPGAAGAPRRGGAAGRPAEGGGGFRPGGRTDVGRRRGLHRRHHQAVRADCVYLTSPTGSALTQIHKAPLQRPASPMLGWRGGRKLVRCSDVLFHPPRHALPLFRPGARVGDGIAHAAALGRAADLAQLSDLHQSARPALCLYRSSRQRGLSFQSAARA